MNFAESLAYIESLTPTILNPSLDRMNLFMKESGEIQNHIPVIHVGGTNGKGSTVAIIDSVLRASGLKVGRFTGPHILKWNERFHLNGRAISDQEFAQYATDIRARSERFGDAHPEHGALTWFEFLTAIAYQYFFDKKVDAAVIEVGLGGRWDATNVVSKPVVTAITTVSLDHTHILGDTVAKIAAEKAGIIKRGVPLVTSVSEGLPVIESRCRELDAPLIHCSLPANVSGLQVPLDVYERASKRLALPGVHQLSNGLVAFVAVYLFMQGTGRKLNEADLEKGFGEVYWPGRMQFLPDKRLLLDGAHNVEGACSLRRALDDMMPDLEPRVFVLSFFQSKNVHDFLKALVRKNDVAYVSQARTTRAVFPANELRDILTSEIGARVTLCSSISDAINRSLKENSEKVIIATGSFATVKDAMLSLGWESV